MSLHSSADSPSLTDAGRRFIKNLLVVLAVQGSRVLMHLPLPDTQKLALWNSLIDGHLVGRPNTFWIRTQFGARIQCSLQDLIQCSLIYFGIWEPNLTAFVERRLQKGDCFVDVGANIGYYSLLASKSVGPNGRIVSIEASPKTFALLKNNLAANDCGNVRAVNIAVASSKGVLQLFSGPDFNSGMTSTLASRGQTFESEVLSDRLSAILLPEELKTARLIKIDVEGAETPVLFTLLDSIDECRMDLEIAVEINPNEVQEHGIKVTELLDRFAKAGFHPYLLHNDYSPVASMERRPVTPPKRLRHSPNELMDLVFSRVDADEL